ncbi:unnamed protein product, partial [Brassica oleracea var. botrytis]
MVRLSIDEGEEQTSPSWCMWGDSMEVLREQELEFFKDHLCRVLCFHQEDYIGRVSSVYL